MQVHITLKIQQTIKSTSFYLKGIWIILSWGEMIYTHKNRLHEGFHVF